MNDAFGGKHRRREIRLKRQEKMVHPGIPGKASIIR